MDSTNTTFTPGFSSPALLTESFTGTTLGSSPWVLGTSRVNTNLPFLTAQSGIDTPGNGALRLTTTAPQQAGFALYNQAIATSGGFTIEFDFASYGGSGADGITCFLAEGGSATPTQSGAPGGSLGYATSRYSSHPGLSGGYVAIGYDEFGGFSDPGNSAAGGPGQRPDSISLRGSAQNQYKYLTGTNTLPSSIDNPASNATRANSTRRTKIDLTASGSLSISIDLNGDQDYSDPGEQAIQNYNLVAANGPFPAPSNSASPPPTATKPTSTRSATSPSAPIPTCPSPAVALKSVASAASPTPKTSRASSSPPQVPSPSAAKPSTNSQSASSAIMHRVKIVSRSPDNPAPAAPLTASPGRSNPTQAPSPSAATAAKWPTKAPFKR
ncbi:MAG: hypothetical protein HC860_10815 [Alkalinema sp. RU_4_3]|nr:hypothetical protein [Alkalinema sp. RU_4_3]